MHAGPHMEEFIEQYEVKHGPTSWEPTYRLILDVLKDFFSLVVDLDGAQGHDGESQASTTLGHIQGGFGLYGVDVLIDEVQHAHLLEVNVSPNCNGIVEEVPTFFDDIFSALFDGDISTFEHIL
jgi:hypothetical protein